MPTVFANNASAVVPAGASATSGSQNWTMSGVTGFPSSLASGQAFHVADPAAPAEKILVTAISGSTWTVTRGDEGTTPLAHAAGFSVQQVVTGGEFGGFVQQLPAPTGVSATDAANIQNAENACNAAGGGTVIFQAGTYIAAGITKYSNIKWKGAGRLASGIQAPAGANQDVVQGYQFTSLTGGGTTGGITGWSVEDLFIDGNGANQTGPSYGVRVYGSNFDVTRVEVRNCYSDGFYSEWGNGGTNMEARVRDCKFRSNGTSGTGIGLNWQGPHDSVVDSVQSFGNATGQFNFDGGATGTLASKCHSYSSTGTYGVRIAAQSVQWSDSVAEAFAGMPAMLVLANGTEVVGGSVYDVNAGSTTGIVIGDGTHAPTTCWIETFVSQTNTACVNFANSGGYNHVALRAYQTSGSVVAGTPAATDNVVLKSASYFAAPGSVPQSNGSLLRTHLPDPNGTAGWYKLGTWYATAGARLRLTVTGAGGYNADVASNAQTVISVSTGSGTPTPNIQGYWFTEGGTPCVDQVKCAKTGSSAETWDVWVHLTANYTGNSFVTADTGSDTFPTTFLWSMASGSDPGVASSTVAVLTQQYQVQSPALFPGGVSIGGGPVATLGLTLLATTATSNPSGYSLVNGTGTILSWTAPSDGLLHRVMIFANLDVTTAETGGKIAVGFTMPDNVAGYTYNLSAGGQGVGYDYSLYSPPPLLVRAGTTVTVSQSTALTAGAAKLWCEIWGS